jgi:hypothetical protein
MNDRIEGRTLSCSHLSDDDLTRFSLGLDGHRRNKMNVHVVFITQT